ncbi:MAG: glycosyltransferase family 2 protein [Xanthomonadaceae bacterium]|nr:glycosyltransferase family 2 protein [Xanthomonadaceae bacterium]MDE2083759.1 glycosyltransferase family 2 protein [Xanthomonadaceae bacterium]
MPREPLSAVVTTFNSAATLERCLVSAAFADDIVVLDSGSTDASVDIARRHGARIFMEAFRDYSTQKQSAIDKAAHDWVLLLDADEVLTDSARVEIERALEHVSLNQPAAAGFRLPRREQMFWTFQHRRSWTNTHLRLIDRRRVRMNAAAVHAAPETDGAVRTLRRAVFLHYGEPDVATKVAKINAYSTGVVVDKLRRKPRFLGVRMVAYPPVFFLRQYIFKRYFLNGWAGFISAATGAYYVFLKYAKVYEARRRERQ